MAEALALYHLAEGLERVAEIGSWKGCSTALIATACGGTVYAIDTWEGTAGTSLESMARDEDIYAVFQENMIALGLWDRIRPMQVASQTAVKAFEDESLDMVFIDADHRYEFVKSDIEAWLPKVKVGGILTGHDAERFYGGLTDNQRGIVDRFIGDDYFYGKANPNYGLHPGPIRALYECLGDEHELLGESIWCYRKPTS